MAAKMDQEADGSKFVRLQIAITDPVAAQKSNRFEKRASSQEFEADRRTD